MTINLSSPEDFEFELLRAVVEQAPDAIPAEKNGKTPGALAIARDVTERHLAGAPHH